MTRFATHDGIPVWTTLALTIHADGSANRQLAGASSFPRHWIYDGDGELAGQSTLIDFKTWWRCKSLAVWSANVLDTLCESQVPG